jgi:hypothetical protein
MNPKMFKEHLSSGLNGGTLLSCYQDGHLRKPINDHKYTIITMLGRRWTRHVMDGYGLRGPIESRKRSVQPMIFNGVFGNGTSSA